MIENSEIKNKITNWLIEEGVTYSESPDEKADFLLHVKWGYDADIVKAKGKSRVMITASYNLTQTKEVEMFNKMTKKELDDFIFDLEVELIKFPIMYDIYAETLQRVDGIVIYDNLYAEDLTKTEFIHSLERVRRAMYFVSLFGMDRLHGDRDPSESLKRTSGVD